MNLTEIDRLVLGSSSPRRKELLKTAGFDFEVRKPDCEEEFPADLPPSGVAIHIARKKSQVLIPGLAPNEILVCADTVVVLDGHILGKPDNDEHAREMLRRLSARTHSVFTGVVIASAAGTLEFTDETLVEFAPLDDDFIGNYVASGLARDKAGSYGAQDVLGLAGIRRIEGSFYNVIGLPIDLVCRELGRFPGIPRRRAY